MPETFEELSLSNNLIGDEGGRAILRARPPRLQRLPMPFNRFGGKWLRSFPTPEPPK